MFSETALDRQAPRFVSGARFGADRGDDGPGACSQKGKARTELRSRLNCFRRRLTSWLQ
jgi:hypothetical protein